MRRTQIYIEDAQDERLRIRAKEVGRTKSELVRNAIDEYFGVSEGQRIRLDRFRSALGATFGVSSDLPSGAEYVETLRHKDALRNRALQMGRET